jgi:hypothetical protein
MNIKGHNVIAYASINTDANFGIILFLIIINHLVKFGWLRYNYAIELI